MPRRLTLPGTSMPISVSEARNAAETLLKHADIRINGDRPWDLQVHDDRALPYIFRYGNLGLGEAFMARWVDVDRVDEFVDRALRHRLDRQVGRSPRLLWAALKARLINHQTPDKCWEVGERHYDLGNDFYRDMLDPRMTYTCGFWGRQAGSLAEAQEHKLEMICRKLHLKPGDRVLDIGCGWGSFMIYAAEHYGVECVGVTISREQAALGRSLAAELPVEFRLTDYRDVNERFDHVVSVGMFEHVGRRNYDTYMSVARRCLKPDGLFLLHTIGTDVAGQPDPWIGKYIFPNGELPDMRQILDACRDRFVVEDVHNFGADYDRTLMAWYENFIRAWPRWRDRYGETFGRMWQYYLQSCAGGFRARDIHLWQFVLSPAGRRGGYRRPV
ncbi:MAG: cyclopropane fatty acyl phospholipid synthase [Halothiobacillaceae bacterium]